MYTVELELKARKFIKSLDKKLQKQILNNIRELSHTPRPQNYKLLRTKEKLYRIRSGDYRIIYQIDEKNKKVIVALVNHRRDVYRKLDR